MTTSINWVLLPIESNSQGPPQITGFSFSGLLLRIESSLDYQRDRDYRRKAHHSVVVIDTHNDLECLRPAAHLLKRILKNSQNRTDFGTGKTQTSVTHES
jgi:hypothetical protein